MTGLSGIHHTKRVCTVVVVHCKRRWGVVHSNFDETDERYCLIWS